MKEAKGHAEASLDSVAQALDRFETYIYVKPRSRMLCFCSSWPAPGRAIGVGIGATRLLLKRRRYRQQIR
jgi:hypothetical protein